MKIKELLLLSITLFYVHSSLSQYDSQFGSIGSVWYYTIYPSSSNSEYLTFISEKDTSINNQIYHQINVYKNNNNNSELLKDLTKYVYTVGGKVYYLVQDEVALLYNFDAEIGDTVFSRVEKFPVDLGCYTDFNSGIIDFSYVIDSIDTVNINNINLKLQHVHSVFNNGPNWRINNVIMDRVGQFDFGSFWWGVGEFCLFEDLGYLRCYLDSQIYFHSPNHNNNECDFTDLEIDYHYTNPILFPNPTANILYHRYDVTILKIFNIDGQLIKYKYINNSIRLTDVADGIYFVLVKLDNKEVKMIKIFKE